MTDAFLPIEYLNDMITAITSALLLVAQTGFDPFYAAEYQLAESGFIAPSGYSIGPAEPGSLPDGRQAYTDPDKMTIVVDMDQVQKGLDEGGSDSAQAQVDVLASILRHEYLHTPDYGDPSPAPSRGYNNGPCQHLAVYREAIAAACNLLERRKMENADTGALCNMIRDWCDQHDGDVAAPGCNAPSQFPCCYLTEWEANAIRAWREEHGKDFAGLKCNTPNSLVYC